ncbi:hypothetical protein Fot_06055 [Forsythia ovata]|uniref:Uncharacterized protein n=1 Tax=Forsythia ovata TaxID=205694 RepID=A0ABD1WRV4_9LAMI
MFLEASSDTPALLEESELFGSLEMGLVKKILDERPVEISPNVLNKLHDPLSNAASVINSYWTDEWAKPGDLALRVYWQVEEGGDDLITTKVLAEANTQRDGLVDKIAHLDETAKSLRVECFDLNGENLKLNSETEEVVKVEVENFRNQFEFTTKYENLQAFFVDFGAQQVLSKLKEQHPNLDFSTIEIAYTAPDEAKEAVDQPPADGN